MSAILETRELCKYFKTAHGLLHAVDGVNLSVEAGKTLGLVGESGCGKSTFGRLLVHLLESTSGQILFEGRDVTRQNRAELKELRSDLQIIFQDPYSSLDPRMSVRQLIAEPLKLKGGISGSEIDERVERLMTMVGLAERFANAYPHEMDGGRRQRIGIARALALEPKFIVCDEPVSALDVSIQAQIINLMCDLQEQLGLTYIFITHDLSVVEYISNDIAVMYLGQLVEKAPTDKLFEMPLHPYTKVLLSAIPIPNVHAKRKRIIVKGELTSPINPAPGCRFAARCHYAKDICLESQTLKEMRPGHLVSCCRAEEINQL